ncbi:MAG: bifunctional 5,10-methylenetetrahydrofolate dehydrogenase/5,10-methenyltetrahydrofolate cyclohydrolase [Candidatus Marinimicrobia bacterium]|nr:bifunctional 5,10-methylenetetrahydrofolate dehydrogenase/5,10-methenyltetrahydrofolate cyclohydrolase [Candidatus Neomarinimicrobiota bacterium]
MDTLLLKGKPVSDSIRLALEPRVQSLKEIGIIPKLAAVIVGDDPASQVYVRNKARAFENLQCESDTHRLDTDITVEEVLTLLDTLNNDAAVHGILVQLPLPTQLDSKTILHAVSPKKDVDGFHPENLGLLLEGNPNFIPCTPYGVLEILKYYEIPVSGRHAVIVGRSNIVGKPMFALLAQKFEMGNATVTICHTGTKDLAAHTERADIIIAAAGAPNMITGNMIKEGVDIIDVGINRVEDDSEKGYTLVGDVNRESVMGIANSVTPVPGGVGPMTITMLLVNTVNSAEKCRKLIACH